MVVYKDPSCGCCHEWANAMKNAGFSVVSKVAGRVALELEVENATPIVGQNFFRNVKGLSLVNTVNIPP